MRVVFVTSTSYVSPWGGGLAGADTICNSHAAGAGLDGTFTAWLSDSTTDAATRLVDGPWKLVDGTPVANSIADLTDGTIQNAISLNELGGNAIFAAWTGTRADGTALDGFHCSSWSPGADVATVGSPLATDAAWTDSWTTFSAFSLCTSPRAFYCFQN